MHDFLDDPMIQAAFGLVVLMLLTTCAYYVVSRFRDYTVDDREDAEQLLAKLREMHLKGDITDEEFRTIKTANRPHLNGAVTDKADASTEAEPQQPSRSPNPPAQT